MDGIDTRPISHDPRHPAVASEILPPSEPTRNERRTMFGMGRSAGVMTVAVIALAAVVIAGLSFGWTGWLAASVGGISILVLLPCLFMCGGMVWMMIKGSNDQSSKNPNLDRRP